MREEDEDISVLIDEYTTSPRIMHQFLKKLFANIPHLISILGKNPPV
jgi:hypothetical protein